MASSINASITSNGIVHTGDSSGVLQLQSDGTTGLTVGAGGKVSLPSTTLGTASAGLFEYNGTAPFFTPLGTQRGVIPGMQYYRLTSGVTGANATGAQSALGVGVTISPNTVYAYELYFYLAKNAGTTSHTMSLAFGGTATLTSHTISYYTTPTSNGTLVNNPVYSNYVAGFPVVITGAITTVAYSISTLVKGTLYSSNGGTFIPQYTLSAAPGGAYNTGIGSYMLIYPIGAAGANVNVGTWA